MKITIKCGSSDVRTYRNRRNENKYFETKKYDDGHTVFKPYMKWDTPEGEVKNYMGSRSNKGRWHRMRQSYMKDLIDDDYEEVVEPEEDLESCQTIESSNKLLYPWVMIGEFEDGYNVEMGGNDIGDCIYKLDQLTDRHGDLIWYGGLNDEYYVDGEYVGYRSVITSAQTTDKIRIKNQTYTKLYDFDGGTYYTQDGAQADEPWVAVYDDGHVETLYNGRHTPWDVTYTRETSFE